MFKYKWRPNDLTKSSYDVWWTWKFIQRKMCQTMLKQTLLLLELFICVLWLLIANILLHYLYFVQGYLNFTSFGDSSTVVNLSTRIKSEVWTNEWWQLRKMYFSWDLTSPLIKKGPINLSEGMLSMENIFCIPQDRIIQKIVRKMITSFIFIYIGNKWTSIVPLQDQKN